MSSSDSGGSSESKDISYDDFAFKLFAIAMLSVVTIPMTFSALWRIVTRRKEAEERKKLMELCGCQKCQDKAQRSIQKEKQWHRSWARPLNVFLLLAWMTIAYLLYSIIATGDAITPFDPFEILGVSMMASEKDIKNAYYKLSRIYHPDQNPNDPKAEESFIKIAKAYKTLTDETARGNYIKYGHPDGYQGTKFGIGLPSAMLEQGNVLLLVYFFALVILFPAIVGFWWRSQSHKLQTSISVNTYAKFGRVIARSGRFRDLIACYSIAFEFENLFRPETARLCAPLFQILTRNSKLELKKAQLFSPNVVLLHAHLNRLEIPESLEFQMRTLLEWVEPLTTTMVDINAELPRMDNKYRRALTGFTSIIIKSIKISQCLIQAVNEKDSPLLQIPGFTEVEVKYCAAKSNNVKTVADFVQLDDSARRRILRSFSGEEMLDVNEFCQRYPIPDLEVSEPKVEEEEDDSVHEYDTVTVNVKLTIRRGKGTIYSPCVWRHPLPKNEVWWVILSDKVRDAPLALKRLLPKDIDPEGNFATSLKFLAPLRGKYDLVVYAICDTYVGCEVYKSIRLTVSETAEAVEKRKYFDTDDESDPDAALSDDDEEVEEEEEEEEEEDEEEESPAELHAAEQNGEEADGDDDDDSYPSADSDLDELEESAWNTRGKETTEHNGN